MERRRKKGGGGIKFQQKISLRLFASCLALPKYCQHTHIHAMVLMTQLKLTMLEQASAGAMQNIKTPPMKLHRMKLSKLRMK